MNTPKTTAIALFSVATGLVLGFEAGKQANANDVVDLTMKKIEEVVPTKDQIQAQERELIRKKIQYSVNLMRPNDGGEPIVVDFLVFRGKPEETKAKVTVRSDGFFSIKLDREGDFTEFMADTNSQSLNLKCKST